MKKKLLLFFLPFFFSVYVSYAQKTISGKVTDADGSGTLPGVSVTVKGTTTGASTNANGEFSVKTTDENPVLVFSFIGYATQEIPVNGRSVVNVSLKASGQNLDEVIVVAYGTATRSTYTGSASTINADKFKEAASPSFENALQGRVSGVQITNTTGQAGTAPSIRIRGIGSISASNEPLYVIDGVPVVAGNGGQLSDYLPNATNNVMASINPSDIESITVLKDAAASSLYGSRAANGVILITTKKGKTGKPTVSFKTAIGFTPTWATDNFETADPQEQINMLYRVFHDLNTSSGKTAAVANADALSRLNTKFNKHGYKFSTAGTGLNENVMISGMTDGIVNREGQYFDWEDALFRTGMYQTNDLSVSGGDANTNYYSSFSYTKDQNRTKINDFDRISGRVNLGQKVGKAVEFITNINIARNNQTGFNDSRNTGANYFMQTRNLLWPLYWPTDYKTGQPFTARFGSLAQNNVFYDNEWENSSITRRITGNETLNIKFLPELNLKSIFSYDNAQIKDHLYYSAVHYNGSATKGSVNDITTNINKLVSSTTLNYNKTFGDHSIGLLGGFELEQNKTDFDRATGTDLPSSSLHTVATAGVLSANSYFFGYNLLSALSRAEYNYKQKYYLSGSYRRDGSSKLDPQTRWGDFWSVSGAWTISNEDFIKNLSYISNLRLRASYGTNGTLPTANYGWRSLIGYGAKYMSQAGGAVSTIADPNLRWETSYSTNVGLEFGLFNQRISGTVEYFNRDSKDLLQDVPISMVTGFSSVLKNVGQVNNKGLELDLGGDIIRSKKVKWGASVNATFLKSKVDKLYGGQDIIWYDPTGSDARAQFIYREGQSTRAFYGYEWAGVDPANGNNVYYVNNPTNASTGDFQFNGRGATYDFKKANSVIIGNAIPKVYGGLNTDVAYKAFTLGLNFNYKIGGDLYNGAYKDVADDGYYFERIRSQDYYDNMWTAQNTSGSEPKIRGIDLTDPMQYSTRQLHSASFVRLKNVTLAYNLPKALVNKIGVSNTRIYFNGTNLLTFSKYKIADPEVNDYGTRGWETPFGKTYTMGLELSF